MNTAYRIHKGGAGAAARMTKLAGLALAALLTLAACAAIRIESQWSSPEFPGYRIKGKVLVVGVSRDATLRRLYEDELTAQLQARGVEAEHSYDSVVGPFARDGNRLILLVAQRAGASAVLSSAVVDREVTEHVIAEPVSTPDLFYDRWFGHYWPYVHARTEVRISERFIISTSLTDVATGKVVWSGRSSAESSENVDKQAVSLAKAIAESLAAQKMF